MLSVLISCQDCRPFGLRLNFGQHFASQQSNEKIGVRFNTNASCQKSYITVQKPSGSIKKISCDSTKLQFGKYSTFIHKCSIVDLKQGDNIQYMAIGWSGNASDPQIPYRNDLISYYFPISKQQFKLVNLADWSYLKQLRTKYKPLDSSFQYLLKNDKTIRGIFINGDVAYDLESNDGLNYQDFLRMLSQVSVSWPVIINPGNHQHRDNNLKILNATFQCYKLADKRITTLKLPMFDLIMFDPYQILYNKEPQNKSYEHFHKKLNQSFQTKNLTVLASHYPFRCNGNMKDCVLKHQQISLFYDAMFQTNVPVYLGAHYHAYQRHYPFKADNTFIKKQGPYEWKATSSQEERRLISVVEGVGGNDYMMQEGPDGQINNFTAFYQYNVTGYGLFKVGQFKLSYEHYNSNDANIPVDSFSITLDRNIRIKLQLRTQ